MADDRHNFRLTVEIDIQLLSREPALNFNKIRTARDLIPLLEKYDELLFVDAYEDNRPLTVSEAINSNEISPDSPVRYLGGYNPGGVLWDFEGNKYQLLT